MNLKIEAKLTPKSQTTTEAFTQCHATYFACRKTYDTQFSSGLGQGDVAARSLMYCYCVSRQKARKHNCLGIFARSRLLLCWLWLCAPLYLFLSQFFSFEFFSFRYLLGFVIFFLIPLPFYSFYYFAYFFFLFFWRDFPCFVLFLLFSRLLSSFDICFVLFSFCFILFCFLHIFPFLPFILFIIFFFPVPSLFPIFYLTLHFLSLFLFFSFSLPPSFILSFAFPFTNQTQLEAKSSPTCRQSQYIKGAVQCILIGNLQPSV